MNKHTIEEIHAFRNWVASWENSIIYCWHWEEMKQENPNEYHEHQKHKAFLYETIDAYLNDMGS